mgnify:CR=1 FL=1
MSLKNQIPFLSIFFGLRPLYPHFRQTVALHAFRALHFMQILTRRRRASASGKRAMLVATNSPYLTTTKSYSE